MTTGELRIWRGKAIRERKWSAFDQYEFLGINQDWSRPDHWKCEGCPDWDDINGCWRSYRSIMLCSEMDEEGQYRDPDWPDDDDDELSALY